MREIWRMIWNFLREARTYGALCEAEYRRLERTCPKCGHERPSKVPVHGGAL